MAQYSLFTVVRLMLYNADSTISRNKSELSPVIKKKINVCRKQSKTSLPRALEHRDDDVHPELDHEVGSELKAK
jgi:hypothetical protein